MRRPDWMESRLAVLSAGLSAVVVIAAAAVVLATSGGSSKNEPPLPNPLIGQESAPAQPEDLSKRTLRGVNTFTFLYTSSNPRYPGEPLRSYKFLARRGIALIRIPFLWKKVQPRLGGPLDPAYLAALKREVRRAELSGLRVVLDLHNSCRYPDEPPQRLCGAGISTGQVADVWRRLSRAFGNDRGVAAYDIMNEPYNISPKVWEKYSQAMVDAIRGQNDNKLLWIEGADFSSVARWAINHPKPWIDDPVKNVMYSGHEYFDPAGTYPRGFAYGAYSVPESTALSRLKVFTDWLARFHERGSIGEVGWPSGRRSSEWRKWNDLGDRWYRAADAAHLWVTYFSATSVYDEKNAAYDAPVNRFTPVPGISVAETQARVIERYPSR